MLGLHFGLASIRFRPGIIISFRLELNLVLFMMKLSSGRGVGWKDV